MLSYHIADWFVPVFPLLYIGAEFAYSTVRVVQGCVMVDSVLVLEGKKSSKRLIC